MLDIDLTRRDVIKTGGVMLVGTLAVGSGVLSALAPSKTWALELNKLDENTGKTLLHITRHIFPHKTLDDAVYALVVKDLDATAEQDKAVLTMLEQGVANLNKKADGNWLALDTAKQAPLVEAMSETEFFEKIRSTAVVSLYNNELAWAHFGYEGPSWPKGGYLKRGFDDLKWLPNPPLDASPRPA